MESKELKKKKVSVSSDAKKEKTEHKVSHDHAQHQVQDHVVHHKKKIPHHITAASIFASEFKKKTPSPILTGISLVILFGLVFLYKASHIPSEQSSNQVVAVKKEYSNSVYGFSFKLPENYSQVREASEPKRCLDNKTWNGKSVTSVTVAEIQNISVTVGCQKLSESIIGQFSNETVTTKEVSVGGRKAYLHEFVTKAGYSWQVAQVALDATHYVEISHNYKPNPEFVAPSDLPLYKPLSEGEWNTLVTSLAFK